MRIRRKLLLLVLFLGAALLVNLMALGYLARTMIAGLQDIEQVALERQLIGVEMQARLRSAEAALYRYVIEGEEGFRRQFEAQLASFEAGVEAYRGQATNASARQWAGALADSHAQAQLLGAEMILLRDQYEDAFVELDQVHTGLTQLLDQPPPSAHTEDPAYRAALDGMQQSLRDMTLAITAYLIRPLARTTVDYTDAVVTFRQHVETLRTLATTPAEAEYATEIGSRVERAAALGLLLMNGRSEQLNHFASFAATLYQAGQEVLVDQLQPQAARDLALAQQELRSALAVAVGSSLFVAIFASIVAAVVIWPLLRRMDSGIQTLLEGAGRVAQGDLSKPVTVEGEDELARLGEVFNGMMADLALRERRIEARLAELETLRQVSLQLTSSLDPQQVLGTIATSASQLVHAAEVRIFVFDREHDRLVFAANVQRDHHDTRAPRLLRDDGITANAAYSGVAQVVNDAATHPLFSSPDMRAWGITAAAALPLKRGDRVLGVLNVSLDDRTIFSGDDLRILELLSDQAAIALENARLYENVTEQQMHLRTLVKKLAQTQEEERRLIGLDLHDGLTQLLLSANMHLATLSSLAINLDEQAAAELQLTRARLGQAIAEARSVVTELRPPALEESGLVVGLRDYCADVARQEGWLCEFTADLGHHTLTPALESAIFRIAQEAIANARKYSRARRVRVLLTINDTHLILAVQDWGQGFDLSQVTTGGHHFGLQGMQERAAVLGGTLEITSLPGRGTRIEAQIPLFAVEEQ